LGNGKKGIMTFTEAAAEVLRLAGKPMHYKEITELAIEKNLLSHVGKSPEVTMGARLAALLKKDDKSQPIVRVKPGVFALREWDEKKGRKKEKQEVVVAEEDTSTDVNALEVEAATRDVPSGEILEDQEEAEERAPVTGEDALRADLAASGAELFDDEDDDDQPILAPAPSAGSAGAHEQAGAEGGRRRRRRRRRGRGGAQQELSGFAQPGAERLSSPRLDGAQMQPASMMTVDNDATSDVSRDPLAPAPRPMVRERQQIMAGGSPTGIEVPLGDGEELAGRELADAAVLVLSGFDRNAGPVPLRSVVDALMRRGRLGGDPAQASIQLSASIRADNLRRTGMAQRPRFRFANGSRVALTEWGLGGELVRLEQEVLSAVERYREAARRTMLRRVQELPGHAFVELALLALERVGMSGLRAVRRPGSPGGEAHFAAVHRTGGDEIRTAIVIRKDGREIGRERVTDLRGALHHYGPATVGWLITSGQVLSGAREEAGSLGPQPIALFDGAGFCKLLEENEVAVVRTRVPVAIPDLEIFEALRG
jgi:hypothetical protein